jgi:chorismate-pyruvate lyase
MKDWKENPAHALHGQVDANGVADARLATPEPSRLGDYLALSGSTTYFLERHAGRRVGVEVLAQRIEYDQARGNVLHRASRLYLDMPRNALLLADVEVFLDRLSTSQRDSMLDGHEGLGRLLDPHNHGHLRKRDLEVAWVPAPPLLCVAGTHALARLFELLMEGEACARIREIVNEESLARLG